MWNHLDKKVLLWHREAPLFLRVYLIFGWTIPLRAKVCHNHIQIQYSESLLAGKQLMYAKILPNFPFCVPQRKIIPNGFGTTWGRINDDRFFSFGWISPRYTSAMLHSDRPPATSSSHCQDCKTRIWVLIKLGLLLVVTDKCSITFHFYS